MNPFLHQIELIRQHVSGESELSHLSASQRANLEDGQRRLNEIEAMLPPYGDYGATAEEIGRAVNCSPQCVRNVIPQLIGRGVVEQVKCRRPWRWRLV